jgi:hypothetical protein
MALPPAQASSGKAQIVPVSAFIMSNIFDRQTRSKCLTAAAPLLTLRILLQPEAVRRP